METTILTRSDVSKLLRIGECITAVEGALKDWALGKAEPPGILGIHAKDGGFHTKAGILDLGRSYFVTKTNANFPNNQLKHALPTIQGFVAVSDATNGRLLALMDSIEITIIRTGAATAVAAKHLSKKSSSILTICGCGNQGAISVKAIREVRPIKKVYFFDLDHSKAEKLSKEVRDQYNIETEIAPTIDTAALASDIIVTCTTATHPILSKRDVRPGTFVAAVGADSDTKQEIDPQLLASARVVVDSLDQCATIGDLHHAIKAGLMTRDSVHSKLGDIIAGLRTPPMNQNDVIVFDSTGIGLYDVAAAAIVYERAAKQNVGQCVNLGE